MKVRITSESAGGPVKIQGCSNNEKRSRRVSKLNKKIGFMGAGNMGEAIVGALIRSGLSDSSTIYISDVLKERCDMMKKIYGVSVMDDNFKLFSECDVIVLAVKPQQTAALLAQIAERKVRSRLKRKLFISIAAGIPLRKIEEILYGPLEEGERQNLPVIRVMPNTPALVMAGISGMSANRYASPEDIQVAKTILGALGSVIEFNEKDLDAVTAVSGSGPAYVFYLIESMIAGGISNGLTAQHAARLTLETLKGAVKLMEERKEPPEDLRRKVTSPGGTTEAAVTVLEQNHVKENIVAAITAATQRSRELSG